MKKFYFGYDIDNVMENVISMVSDYSFWDHTRED